MIQYILVAIVLVAIPFLLYCLWNFAREIDPRRSRVVVAAISSAAPSRAIRSSSFRTEPEWFIS